MGRLIDADFILNKMKTTDAQPVTYSERYAWDFATVLLNNAPTVEAILKADYEARLKADMVAMLEDLNLQIDESAAYNLEVAKVQRLIRDKINILEGKDNDK